MISLSNLREHQFGVAVRDFISGHVHQLRPRLIFSACAFTVACSLLLGGVAQAGELSDAILELLAIPALLIALSALIDLPNWKTGLNFDAYWGLILCAAIAFVPLIQLVPLPPMLWTALPGREPLVRVFDVLDRQLPWMPLSVSPSSTWLSLLALIPPIAIFIAAIQLSYRERRTIVLLVVGFAVVSVFLGLIQLAQGPQSILRFYPYTAVDDAVGFFGNRDHLAALLYAALIFASAWVIDIGYRVESWADLRKAEQTLVLKVTASFLIFVILLVGEVEARSRAGIGLTIVGLLAVFALAYADPRRVSERTTSRILVVAVGVAAMLSVQFALYRVLDRFTQDPLQDARFAIAATTIGAAKTFLPFGSGLGTFVPVYMMFEKPANAVMDAYINHAHNDFLELLLETGLMGCLLLGLFAFWFGSVSAKLWRRPIARARALDWTLARGATVVIVLLLVHSLVDFSLQTEALMSVFAFSCALLVEPCCRAEPEFEAFESMEGRLHRPQPRPPLLASGGVRNPGASMPAPVRMDIVRTDNSRSTGGRWGTDVEWPEEWRGGPEQQPEESEPLDQPPKKE